MRNTIVATGVALLMTTGLVGCKSAPKMPWSRTAEKSGVESTTLAHSAPELPADIAKEAEALAASTPSIEMTTPSTQASGGQAAPFSPAPTFTPTPPQVAAASAPSLGSGAKTTPAITPTTPPYPTTGAPKVAANTAPITPTPRSFDKAADLGTIVMPYNPNAVPPAKTVVSAEPITPIVSNDRYGNSSLANTALSYPSTSAPKVNIPTVPQANSGDRYGNLQAAVPAPPVSSAPAPSVNLASTGSVPPQMGSTLPAYTPPSTKTPPLTNIAAPVTNNASGDRYGITSSVPQVTISPTMDSPVAPTREAPLEVAASAPSYRPGGTSSYETMTTRQPVIEVATRPKVEATVPNVAVPGTTTAPTEAPRYR